MDAWGRCVEGVINRVLVNEQLGCAVALQVGVNNRGVGEGA